MHLFGVYEGADSAQLHLLVCYLHRRACLTRNLCISLTRFCLCNSPNMLGVSSAANRAPCSLLDNPLHHIKDVIASWDLQ